LLLSLKKTRTGACEHQLREVVSSNLTTAFDIHFITVILINFINSKSIRNMKKNFKLSFKPNLKFRKMLKKLLNIFASIIEAMLHKISINMLTGLLPPLVI
jgi:hypothetical protein